ncbi:MAG: type II secretion system major pseudopilin GspG [Verrucomicrobiota bacterium]
MKKQTYKQLFRQFITSKRSGFSLMEIMIVLGIIMVLMGTVIYKMQGMGNVAKVNTASYDIQAISAALNMYESMNLRPPSSEQGLNALVVKPSSSPKPRKWTQFIDEVPMDPWGNEYVYSFPGKKNARSFDLYSKGPDRLEGTEDDIGNWE